MIDKMKPIPVTARDLNSDESDGENIENITIYITHNAVKELLRM